MYDLKKEWDAYLDNIIIINLVHTYLMYLRIY